VASSIPCLLSSFIYRSVRAVCSATFANAGPIQCKTCRREGVAEGITMGEILSSLSSWHQTLFLYDQHRKCNRRCFMCSNATTVSIKNSIPFIACETSLYRYFLHNYIRQYYPAIRFLVSLPWFIYLLWALEYLFVHPFHCHRTLKTVSRLPPSPDKGCWCKDVRGWWLYMIKHDNHKGFGENQKEPD